MTEEPQKPALPSNVAAMKANEKATQFGQPGGNIPQPAIGRKVRSIQQAMRHMAAQEVCDPKNMLPSKPTWAQQIAAKIIVAAANGDMKASNTALDRIDGKVVQVNINTDLEKYEGMTEEELHEHNRKLDERIAAALAGGHDAGGDGSAQGDDSSPDGEGQGEQEGPAGA